MKITLDHEVAMIAGIVDRIRTAAALLPGDDHLMVSVEGAHLSGNPPTDHVQLTFCKLEGEPTKITKSAELVFFQIYDSRLCGELSLNSAEQKEIYEESFSVDLPSPEPIGEMCDLFVKIIYEFFLDGRQPIQMKDLLFPFH